MIKNHLQLPFLPSDLHHSLHKKWSFSLRISSANVADLITFTEEILNGKLHFLCSDYYFDY